MKKSFLALLLLVSLSSCYDPKTHGRFLSEHADVWIDGYSVMLDEHKKADKGLVYCRSNVTKDGDANPVCYKAKFK